MIRDKLADYLEAAAKYTVALLLIMLGGLIAYQFAAAGPQAQAAQGQASNEPVTPKEVFKNPDPRSQVNDPKAIEAMSNQDKIQQRLTALAEHLLKFRASYGTQSFTRERGLEVLDELQKLLGTARAEVSYSKRETKDLYTELGFSEASLRYLANDVTNRAGPFKDSGLRQLGEGITKDYEVMSKEAPERQALCQTYMAQLDEMDEFLSDCEKALAMYRTYVLVVSAGKGPPKVESEKIDQIRTSLDTFIKVSNDYLGKMTNAPKPPAPPVVPVVLNAPPSNPAPRGGSTSGSYKGGVADVSAPVSKNPFAPSLVNSR